MGTVITAPLTGSVTTNNTPLITGTAEAGATVTVYVNGNVVGTAVANGSGVWTFTPPTPLADGAYVVSAAARDQAGAVATVACCVARSAQRRWYHRV